MLNLALIFLLIACVAAALGFGGLAGTAAGIAKGLFILVLGLVAASLVVSLLRG